MRRIDPDEPEIYELSATDQLPVFVDTHREMLAQSLDGLTEAEVRTSLVPSSMTLLGLVKHATFVERVWFEEAVSGRPRTETGIAAGPEESFELAPRDTIESVLGEFRQAVEHSRYAVTRLGLDATVSGNRRGPLPMHWIMLHLLRELAQHGGHADILREPVMAART